MTKWPLISNVVSEVYKIIVNKVIFIGLRGAIAPPGSTPALHTYECKTSFVRATYYGCKLGCSGTGAHGNGVPTPSPRFAQV